MSRDEMSRKRLSAIALTALVLTLAPGCGSGGAAGGAEAPPETGGATETEQTGEETRRETTRESAGAERPETSTNESRTQRSALQGERLQRERIRERRSAAGRSEAWDPVTIGGVRVSLREAFVTRGPGGMDARGDDAPEWGRTADYVLGSFEVENVSREPVQFGGMLALMLYAEGSRAGEQRPTPLEGQLSPESLPQRYRILPMQQTLAPGESISGGVGWAVVARPGSRLSVAYNPSWLTGEEREPQWKLGPLQDLPRKRFPPQL